MPGQPTIVLCDHCGKKNRVPAAASGVPHCARCHEALAWVADAGDDDWDDVVARSKLPVLVDLWAPWCGPCRMVSPVLESLAHSYAGRVKLVKVNVDEAPGISQRFSVQAIPTLLVTSKGEVLARQAGAAAEAALRAWIDRALASAPVS
jgi:thioredoxin 2